MNPHVVICNDDGICEPGIFQLVKSLMPYFKITVVAPAIQQSGKGLGITLHEPIKIEKYDFGLPVEAFKVTGTPADCIKLALSKILPEIPDAIIAGINPGDNSGRNALYSGTVGATIEGVMRGITGIAFSCLDYDNPPFEEFSQFIPTICQYFITNKPPFGTTINVNCPLKELGPIKGVKIAKQGMSYWCENTEILKNSPMLDHEHYLGASWVNHEECPSSDVSLLKEGFITAVPIKVDQLTNHEVFVNEQKKFSEAINILQSSLI